MKDITGKTLFFTDQHFGIKGNAQSRQKICVSVIKNIISYAKKNNISTIIFGGDYFHQRNQLSIDTIDIAQKCIRALASICRVIMVLGNHDLFNKNTVDVNSINIFKDIQNVEIVYSTTSLDMNGKSIVLVPWLGDISGIQKETYDFAFGHFDVSSKYLIQSYVEANANKTSASGDSSSYTANALGLEENTSKSSMLVGDFVDIVKKNGTIFAGHIHTHKEFRSKGRNFIFAGSPYQQTLGDIDCKCGFYEIDCSGKYKFIEIDNVPKHIQIKTSEVMEVGLDKYDFSKVRGNIVQKVYDIDVSSVDDTMINKKISDYQPYEELLPDYRVQISTSQTSNDNEFVQSIKKSKLEYVKKYIESIDDSILEEQKIDKEILFKLMKKYYDMVEKQ